MHKLKPTLLKKTQHCLNYFVPQSWFFAPKPSTVFDSNDCIWYYGTLYVKEAVAVQQLQQQPATAETLGATSTSPPETATSTSPPETATSQPVTDAAAETNHCVDGFDDDDTESISSGNSAFKTPRSIGKQNQLKYLKDGMQLRHHILVDHASHEWSATFDAETNRIIRTPDGVAFDTLRQFARLHCNEVLSVDSSSTNVWSDPHFQYKDADYDAWHPLSNLKH